MLAIAKLVLPNCLLNISSQFYLYSILESLRYESVMGTPIKKQIVGYEGPKSPEAFMMQLIEFQGDLTLEHSTGPLYGIIADGAHALFGAKRVAIAVFENGSLTLKASYGFDSKQIQVPPYDRLWNLMKECHTSGRGRLSTPAASVSGVTSLQRESVLSAPLAQNNRCFGAILIEGNYTQKEFELFNLFANQASIAIENAKLFERLQGRASTFSDSPSTLASSRVPTISTADVPTGTTLDQIVAKFEGEVINKVIAQHHGNKTLAAKSLGITRGTLYNKLNAAK